MLHLNTIFLRLRLTVYGIASKGLRAISYQVTRKIEAGYNPPNNSQTLIRHTVC